MQLRLRVRLATIQSLGQLVSIVTVCLYSTGIAKYRSVITDDIVVKGKVSDRNGEALGFPTALDTQGFTKQMLEANPNAIYATLPIMPRAYFLTASYKF